MARHRLAAAVVAGAGSAVLVAHGAAPDPAPVVLPPLPPVPHRSSIEVSRSQALRLLASAVPTTTSTTTEPAPAVAPPPTGADLGRLVVTAYCDSAHLMADGHRVHAGAAAADAFAFGTHLEVAGFGTVTVEDRSAPGATAVDLWMASCAAARQWGRRWADVRRAAA